MATSKSPMETIREPIPRAEDIQWLNPNTESIDTLFELRQEATEKIVELKKVVADCDLKIGATLDLNSKRAVVWRDKYVVSRREGTKPRESLDKMRLLELGVPAHVIKAATVLTAPGRPGVTFRKTNREDEPEEPDGNF